MKNGAMWKCFSVGWKLPELLLAGAVVAAVLLAPGCKKDDSKPSTDNTQFRQDVQTVLEFNAVKQGVMIDIVKTMTDDYTKPIGQGTYTKAELDNVYKKLFALEAYRKNVTEATARLDVKLSKGFQGKIAQTRGLAGKLGEFFGWLSGSAKNSRDRIVTVSSNLTPVERTELYNNLRPEWKSQTSSESDFWNKLQEGKFDNAASQMYNDMYHDPNTNFSDVAQDKTLTPANIFVKEGSEGVTKGAEVMVEVVKNAAPGLGEGVELVEKAQEYTEKIENLYNDPKQAIKDEVKDAIADYLGGFIDIDGAVDEEKISEEMGEAIKILTDYTLGSDDPADWVKDAIDLGISKLKDESPDADKSDIAIGVKADDNTNPNGPKVVISVDPATDNSEVDDVIDIMLPGGDWIISTTNTKGNSDKVTTESIPNVASVIPVNTDPNAPHNTGAYALSVWISPADPGPGEGVTVTAKISPAKSGIDIFFSITGTDGYSNSATTPTDTEGKATFYIPGGASGVRDEVHVKIVSTGTERILNYTF